MTRTLTSGSVSDLYLARGADFVREPTTDETASVRWVPLDQAAAMISSGEIIGATTESLTQPWVGEGNNLSHDHDSGVFVHAATIRAS